MEKWKTRFYPTLGYMLLTVGGILLAAVFALQTDLNILLRGFLFICGVVLSGASFAVIYFSIQMHGIEDQLAELYAEGVRDHPEIYETMKPIIVDEFKASKGRDPTQEELNEVFADALIAMIKKKEVE